MKRLYILFLLMLSLVTLTAVNLKGGKNEQPSFCYADRHASSNKIQCIGGSISSSIFACIETPELKSKHTLNAVNFYSNGYDQNGEIIILDSKQRVIFSKNIIIRKGYNNVKLEAPFELGPGIFYIGYCIQPTKDYSFPVALDGDIAIKQACWIGVLNDPNKIENGTEIKLNNITSYNKGSLIIEAAIDGPDVENCAFPLEVQGKLEMPPNVYGTLKIVTRNVGTKPIKTLTCKTELDGSFTSTELSGRVEPGETASVNYRYKFPSSGVRKQVTLNYTKVNAQDNPLVANFIKFMFDIRESNEPFEVKSILIEEYTSEKCGNCPRGRPFIRDAKENFVKTGYEVSVIAYHNGYKPDKWATYEAGQLIPYLFPTDRSFAPAAMINRLAVGKGGSCAFVLGLGFYNLCKRYIEGKMQYGEITILNYDGKNVVIEGSLSKGINPEDVVITAVITENGIKPIAQQGAMEEGYTHDHVARKFITSAFGNKLNVNNDLTFKLSLDVTDLPLDTKIENTEVVVFASKPISKETMKLYGNRQVLFSKSCKYNKETSVKSVDEPMPQIKVEDGYLSIDGEIEGVSVYDMHGRIVSDCMQAYLIKGSYIIKIRTNRGKNIIRKIMIK